MLAGAGVANLAAWLGVQLARDAGSDVKLTAEIGLWDYDATLGDPFVLNHRNFPTATMLADAQFVLGALVGGAGHDDDRLSRRRAGRPLRQHQLHVDPAASVPRRLGRRQRRREHRGRERDRRDADRAAHRRRLRLRDVAGHARAGARHRPRHVREARRRAAGERARAGRVVRRRARAVRLGPAKRRARAPVLDEPTADEVAALRRWDPRLVPPRQLTRRSASPAPPPSDSALA